MSPLHVIQYIVRPHHVLMGAISTWIVAVLCGGNLVGVFYAPQVMGLAILGTSLFYFGDSNDMYARKNKTLLIGSWFRGLLIVSGVLLILSSVYISFGYLNFACQLTVILDGLIIMFYHRKLARRWLTKNLSIAWVCISPILLGMFVGNSFYSSVLIGAVAVFLAYLAKEIVNDVKDLEVDKSHRRTLVLCLDVSWARHIACMVMTLSVACVLWFMLSINLDQWYVFVSVLVTLIYFFRVIYSLGFKQTGQETTESTQIILGTSGLMISFFLLTL